MKPLAYIGAALVALGILAALILWACLHVGAAAERRLQPRFGSGGCPSRRACPRRRPHKEQP